MSELLGSSTPKETFQQTHDACTISNLLLWTSNLVIGAPPMLARKRYLLSYTQHAQQHLLGFVPSEANFLDLHAQLCVICYTQDT